MRTRPGALATALAAIVVGGAATLLVVSGGGLVGHWRGDGNALDKVRSNDGIINGGVSFVDGRSGLAFRLDGEDDYVEVLNHPTLNPTSFTLAAWVRTEQATEGTVIAKPACGGQRYGLYVGAGRAVMRFTPSGPDGGRRGDGHDPGQRRRMASSGRGL